MKFDNFLKLLLEEEKKYHKENKSNRDKESIFWNQIRYEGYDFPEYIGPCEVIVDERSSGDGDYNGWELVLYFSKHDIYVMVEGWYSSYEGSNLDSPEVYQVFPCEQTITVYKTQPE